MDHPSLSPSPPWVFFVLLYIVFIKTLVNRGMQEVAIQPMSIELNSMKDIPMVIVIKFAN